MDEIGMFTALRPRPGPLDVNGARDRLAATLTGAPDRRRVSRRTRFAAAGLVPAAAAVVTAVTLTAGSAPPALATVTSALTRTLSQSYHLTEQDSGLTSGLVMGGSGRIVPIHIHGTCVSVADPVRHLWSSSCSSGFAERQVGGYTYLHMPITVHPAKPWIREPGMFFLSLSSPWSLVDFRITVATPQQMLSVIKKAGKVTVAGPASGPGWTGTRYTFSSTERQDKISGTLDVDRQGRARVLILTTTSPDEVETQVLTFSDFGARVTVTPPPADQIFSRP